MLKKLFLCAGLFGLAATTNAAVTYDGHYTAGEYTTVFDIDYEYDEKIVEGGLIAIGSDGSNQYLYIQHPLGFTDLSYGNDGTEKYRVGWNNQDDHKDLGNAMSSEYFKLSLKGGGTHTGTFDLGVENSGNSLSGSSIFQGFLSTLDYNRFQVSGNYANGALGVFADHSPETVDCVETSSDPTCYVLVDTEENRLGDNNNPIIDWDFNYGIEIKLENNFFANIAAITKNDFVYKDSGAQLISLDSLHASDPKIVSLTNHDAKCIDGSSAPDHEPCNASVTPHTPTEVPEPSTTALFALGLAGLWAKRRKVNAL